MTDRIEVPAGEHGVTRLFALNLTGEAARALALPPEEAPATPGTWPLMDALGVDVLDPAWVDVIDTGEMGEIGLKGYLSQGLGLPETELKDAQPQIAALRGLAVVIGSRAFKGRAVTLRPKAPLRWVASFRDTPDIPSMEQTAHPSAAPESPAAPGFTHSPEKAVSFAGKLTVILIALLLIGGVLALIV